MENKKISVIDAISFGFRAILEHIRLFFFVLLVGSGLIVLVVGIIGFFNLNLLISLSNTPMFQSIQECIGAQCFTIVYQSGIPLISFIFNNFISLLLSVFILFFFSFLIVFKIIIYVGYLTYVGIILTWPLSTLAYTYFYRQLVPRNR